ncbi:Rtf2 RING-finger-domain-containing protein [Lactarius psammicola]|nr:Rtf2 RING-finger-domain-containing protein [Lactarius psammicola]
MRSMLDSSCSIAVPRRAVPFLSDRLLDACDIRDVTQHSIPDRRDLVRNKPKAEQADKANQTRARWFFCALSKRPLQEPVVSCELGKLYNKDAVIEFLLDRSAFGDGEDICGHIRSLKVCNTSLSDSGVDRGLFVCPLNLKEMTGVVPFVYLSTCGCVFSQAGLKAVSTGTPPSEKGKDKDKDQDKDKDRPASGEGAAQLDVCPQCATKFDRSEDVRVLNPGAEEEERMQVVMERRRASASANNRGKSKKRKDVGVIPEGSEAVQPPGKKKKSGSGPGSGRASPAPSMVAPAASRAVASSLAMEEAKRKAQMSDAVKSLYRPKDGKARKETFMTMGTFTRYA